MENQKPADLIYGIEDRPSFKDALFAAVQHLLAIFVAIITPPLIIAGALKLDLEKTSFLVSMALFASGVSTFIQCRRFGPIEEPSCCAYRVPASRSLAPSSLLVWWVACH